MKKLSYVITLILVIGLVGCNLPSTIRQETQSPDAVFTQAAQTVAAELTRVSLLSSPTSTDPIVSTTTFSPIPTDTFSPTPTNTTAYTPTNTSIPCNLATFVIDVTVLDYELMVPNQIFTKIWRIRNAGSCSWNSSYLLIFDHGDGMGITTGYTQPLTASVVNPGQNVDLSVNLKAPASPGTYTGYWTLRDPGGVVFGITPAHTPFIVVIKVTAPAITLNPVVGESGTIRSDWGPGADYTVGESNADITRTCETFLSYDITGIPATATITDVKFDFTAYTITSGNPFGSLGTLNAYATNYGPTLEAGDFVAGFPPGAIANWSSAGALNIIESSPDLKANLQSKLGTSRLQLRLQFAGSNLDAVKDRITFTNPSLIVTYTTP